MTSTSEELAEEIGRAILGQASSDPDGAEGSLTAEEHLRLVARSATAHEVTGALLQQSVTAARAGGVSWARLGATLGLSRQGAQQRFGGGGVDSPEDEEERWLGPVTALDEMAELRIAGELGWRTVGVDWFRHRMVRSETRWEHRRVLWSRPRSHLETDGWQVAVRAFPWVYLVRDTGVPVGEHAGRVASAGE